MKDKKWNIAPNCRISNATSDYTFPVNVLGNEIYWNMSLQLYVQFEMKSM